MEAESRVAERSDETEHQPGPASDGELAYLPKGVERKTGLWPTLKRTAAEYSEDNLGDWAATLTYYGLLALFPALIALISIVGLVADPASATKTLTDIRSVQRSSRRPRSMRGLDLRVGRETNGPR